MLVLSSSKKRNSYICIYIYSIYIVSVDIHDLVKTLIYTREAGETSKLSFYFMFRHNLSLSFSKVETTSQLNETRWNYHPGTTHRGLNPFTLSFLGLKNRERKREEALMVCGALKRKLWPLLYEILLTYLQPTSLALKNLPRESKKENRKKTHLFLSFC